ncbi:MAG: hypothetical protein GY705_25110 [Bacteroidetes bacterium]|nr:hypothetical protein [Bacteroidota bacterium]
MRTGIKTNTVFPFILYGARAGGGAAGAAGAGASPRARCYDFFNLDGDFREGIQLLPLLGRGGVSWVASALAVAWLLAVAGLSDSLWFHFWPSNSLILLSKVKTFLYLSPAIYMFRIKLSVNLTKYLC